MPSHNRMNFFMLKVWCLPPRWFDSSKWSSSSLPTDSSGSLFAIHALKQNHCMFSDTDHIKLASFPGPHPTFRHLQYMQLTESVIMASCRTSIINLCWPPSQAHMPLSDTTIRRELRSVSLKVTKVSGLGIWRLF